MLVQDKPAPVRISSVLTARHLLPRTKYPLRKYKNEGSMVPLFSNDDTPTTLKADALFIPRENPWALINCPMDQWPRKASEKASFKGISSREANTTPNDRTSSEDREILDVVKEQVQPVPTKHTSNGSNEDHSLQKADMYKSLSGHRAGVEALLPKLRNEVTDFIVGRHGYGSIKFFGATDVRWLDLESIIQFNNYGVSVYKDDSKKPPVGQGLNKPAEITLLNIKCFDKQNELEYKEVLKSMAKNQGAEYVSYDATKGEWIFKVHHFSSYENVFSFDHECSICILGSSEGRFIHEGLCYYGH
ncbi:hypothetical protein TSUD_266610 [Trifolium subterraneum]|uniref:Peptidase S59 domain-containing protein n=1 Tax=Trifolium subterraneum TaxID=3900 RepID=A0A2Z6NB89_TRISU|nr:hypothetical protein TSUD_266610 [Trifolium subterraneum]